MNDTKDGTGKTAVWFAGFVTGFALRGILESSARERMHSRIRSFKTWHTSTTETLDEFGRGKFCPHFNDPPEACPLHGRPNDPIRSFLFSETERTTRT